MKEKHLMNNRILGLNELLVTRPELFEPIPLRIGVTTENPEGYENGSVADWRGTVTPENRIEIIDNGESLVSLAQGSFITFCTNDYAKKLGNSAYEQELPGSYLSSFARESVREMLKEAQALLPFGYRLIVFDVWRSLETQYAAYKLCFDSLVSKLVKEGVINEQIAQDLPSQVTELISRETQKYISLPSPKPDFMHPTAEEVEVGKKIPSPHNTGGSVDAAIVRIDDEKLEELESIENLLLDDKRPDDDPDRISLRFRLAEIYRMHSTMPNYGTNFDYAGEEAALTFYETNAGNEEVRNWRRMLYNVMTKVGFKPYSDEWWHYNYGNQMARTTELRETGVKAPAIYGGIDLTPEQKDREHKHTMVFGLLVKLALNPNNIIGIPDELRDYVTVESLKQLSANIGDPRSARSLGDPHDMVYRGNIPKSLIDEIRSNI